MRDATSPETSWRGVARRLWRSAVLATLALAAFLLGAFASDPVNLAARLNERRLLWAGAVKQTYSGPDGLRLAAFELNPASRDVPVVMLHGLGASAAYWADAALFLQKRGRSVILPDAPGSGSSEAPRTDAGWGLPARVAAVGALARAFDRKQIDLVGHSLGGWTAALFALDAPWRVRRLVLVDPGGFETPGVAEADRQRLRLYPATRDAGRALVDLLFFRRPFPGAGFVVDGIARNYRRTNTVKTVAAIREEDFLDGRESALPPGTVFIWGERETLFPIAQGRRAAARAPGARLLVVTGVGHDGPLEAPRAFHEALAAALGGTTIVPARSN